MLSNWLDYSCNVGCLPFVVGIRFRDAVTLRHWFFVFH